MSIVPRGAAAGTRGGLAPVARRLHAWGVSANTVTFLGLLLTLVAAALIAGGQPWPALVVVIIGTLADTLDGQIAKAAGGGTKLGAFLDSTFDRVSDGVLTAAAIVYGAYRDDALLLSAGLVALVFGSLIPYVRAKAESLGLTAAVGLAPREARIVLYVLGIAAWAITGNSQLFAVAVAVIAFLSTLTAIQRIAHVANVLRNS